MFRSSMQLLERQNIKSTTTGQDCISILLRGYLFWCYICKQRLVFHGLHSIHDEFFRSPLPMQMFFCNHPNFLTSISLSLSSTLTKSIKHVGSIVAPMLSVISYSSSSPPSLSSLSSPAKIWSSIFGTNNSGSYSITSSITFLTSSANLSLSLVHSGSQFD